MEQLADEEQCRALGYILLWLKSRPAGGTMAEVLSRLYEKLQKEGLSSIASPECPPFMAVPRLQEIFACVNRCRL